jgi:hypothetical protein
MTPAAETKDGGRGRPRANPSLGTQCRLREATDRSFLANRETRGGRPARIILGDPRSDHSNCRDGNSNLGIGDRTFLTRRPETGGLVSLLRTREVRVPRLGGGSRLVEVLVRSEPGRRQLRSPVKLLLRVNQICVRHVDIARERVDPFLA